MSVSQRLTDKISNFRSTASFTRAGLGASWLLLSYCKICISASLGNSNSLSNNNILLRSSKYFSLFSGHFFSPHASYKVNMKLWMKFSHVFPTSWLWAILEKGYVLFYCFLESLFPHLKPMVTRRQHILVDFFFFYWVLYNIHCKPLQSSLPIDLSYIMIIHRLGQSSCVYELGDVLYLNSVLQCISSKLLLRISSNVTWKLACPYYMCV